MRKRSVFIILAIPMDSTLRRWVHYGENLWFRDLFQGLGIPSDALELAWKFIWNLFHNFSVNFFRSYIQDSSHNSCLDFYRNSFIIFFFAVSNRFYFAIFLGTWTYQVLFFLEVFLLDFSHEFLPRFFFLNLFSEFLVASFWAFYGSSFQDFCWSFSRGLCRSSRMLPEFVGRFLP